MIAHTAKKPKSQLQATRRHPADTPMAYKPDRKTFLGISSFQVLAMFRRGLFYSFLSIYLRFFLGLSVTETTFFATFPMILNVLFQTFVWGKVSDRFQLRRTLIVAGELSAALSTFLVWYVHTLPESDYLAGYAIIIGLSIVEIFWSMSNIGWSAILSDLYPEDQRAGLQGRLSSIGAIGRIIGVSIGGLAYDGLTQYYEGWGFDQGLLFFIASGIMIVSTIPMFFVPEGGVKSEVVEIHQERGGKTPFPRKLLVFLLAMVFINFGRNSVILMTSQYLSLDEGFNVSSSLLSHIVNTSSAAIFIVGLFIRRLSERFEDQILLLLGNAAAIIYLSGFILATTLPAIFISNFLAGVANVVITASSYSYASRLISPEQRGRHFSFFNATLFLSWGIPGTFITGPIVDYLIRSGASQTFSYKMSFLTAVILVLIGSLITLVGRRIREKTGLPKTPNFQP
ncbi:MAG: MFS transporter [Candidatus Bathyarchaeota archaeon]|nr:MAG: MFS transporter [Candidatus Bathyarchaeota archaeon]